MFAEHKIQLLNGVNRGLVSGPPTDSKILGSLGAQDWHGAYTTYLPLVYIISRLVELLIECKCYRSSCQHAANSSFGFSELSGISSPTA